MMSYALTNTVKDIQISLKECGFYTLPTDRVDGLWGPRTAGETQKLLEGYAKFFLGSPDKAIPIIRTGHKNGFPDAVRVLQNNLKVFKLYTGAIDGIWGKGSVAGITKLTRQYRSMARVQSYMPAWSKLVPEQFYRRVEEWCEKKGYFPNAASALMSCMHFESAGTFSPTIRNKGGSNYYGLIQFGTAAAKDLGYTLPQVIAMSQMEQLELVFKYFEMWERRGKKITQLEDFYLCILYPAAVGKKADATLWVDGTTVYRQNSGFDKNRDGKITIGEISQTLYDTYYTGMDPRNRVQANNLY